MPDSMHVQRVSLGSFDGTAPLIAFYAPVSKTRNPDNQPGFYIPQFKC